MKINWKQVEKFWEYVVAKQMATVCCQRTNLTPNCVAYQKAMIFGQKGLFATRITFFSENKT